MRKNNINNKINLKCPHNKQHNTEYIWEQESFGHLIVLTIFLKGQLMKHKHA